MSKETAQLIEKIRTALDEDTLSKVGTYLNDLGSSLRTIERTVSDQNTEIHEVNEESKGRKLDKRNLQEKIDDLEDKLRKANDNTAMDDLKEENKGLKEYKDSQMKDRRKKFDAKYIALKDHPDFEKAKPHLNLPEEKDGKIDFTDLDDDVIDLNLSEIEKMTSLGLFQFDKDNKPIERPGHRTTETENEKDDEFSVLDN